MYYVYVLYSPKLNSFYKGQTANLKERIKRHNKQQEKSTKTGIPWLCLWSITKNSRSEALKLEIKLKNLSRQRTIALMIKYKDGITGHDEALIIQRLS